MKNKDWKVKEGIHPKNHFIKSLAEILTSNSVGTQLFFLGCDLDNNPGSNFITKKKICLVLKVS